MKRTPLLTAAVVACLAGGLLTTAGAAAADEPSPDPHGNTQERQLATPVAGPKSLVKSTDVNDRATSVRPDTVRKAPASVRAQAGKVRTDKTAAKAVAKAHLKEVAKYFGARDKDLKATTVAEDASGTIVRADQVVDGVPVFGGQIVTALDDSGALLSASGQVTLATYGTFPTAADQAAAQKKASSQAVKVVADMVESKHPELKVTAADLHASAPVKNWFDVKLLDHGIGSYAVPAYRFEVTDGPDVRYTAFVHASGEMPLLAWDEINEASDQNRVVCDANRTQVADTGPSVRCGSGDQPFAPARTEGQKATGEVDVDSVYDFFGDTAELYKELGVNLTDLIGSDYGDDIGKAIRGTVRICNGDCPYANAFWNGEQMAFGEGVSTDDVTGHELSHGVTERISGLAYMWESGAINEALSDIFGEFVDLTNGSADDTAANRWLIGEGSSLGAIRSMSDPTAFKDPDSTQSSLWALDASWSDNGGVHTNSGVANKAAYLTTDGGTFNGQKVKGLGIDRSERLWWGAAQRLTTGSAYTDLAEALRASCDGLAKHAKKTGFTKADCGQVDKVITATAMDRVPAAAAAKRAPLCDPQFSTAKKPVWKTSFTKGESNKVVFGAKPNSTNPDAWSWAYSSDTLDTLGGTFSNDGDDSAVAMITKDAGVAEGALTMAKGVKVKKANTFLRFEHADGFISAFFGLDNGYGKVEYTVDGGKTWTNAAELPWVNGPNGPASAADDPDVIGPVFKGSSFGWATSRVDLTSLRGKTVSFRWVPLGSYASWLLPGTWYLDNAAMYECAK